MFVEGWSRGEEEQEAQEEEEEVGGGIARAGSLRCSASAGWIENFGGAWMWPFWCGLLGVATCSDPSPFPPSFFFMCFC